MSRDFLITVGNQTDCTNKKLANGALYELGMHLCFEWNHICIFVSENTPLMRAPDGSIIIGDVFTQSLQRLTDNAALEGLPRGTCTWDACPGGPDALSLLGS